MQFHYIASQPGGQIVEGDTEAQNPAGVIEFLAQKGLRPISIKVIKESAGLKKNRFFGKKITVSDKVFITKYLALMLKVDTDLFKAIDILIADFDKPVVKALLLEVRSNLEKGQPFYLTFSKYPKYFSPVFVNLIKAGESSGNLENILDELSFSLQKEQDLRQKIKSAMTYPVVLSTLAVSMITFLVMFALPRIATFFTSNSMKPPFFSQVIFTVGLFLNQYIYLILVSAAIAGFVLWYAITKTISGKRLFQHFVYKIPVISNVLKKIALQRFASTLSSLLKAGLPILDSLEITAETVGNEGMKDALLRISREGISKGLGIGEAFRRETAFPRVVVNLMAISEKAGHVESVLQTISGFYESEIDSSIKILLSLLEPAMLVVLGVIIAVIALAIIVPVYQLVGQI